MLLLTTLIGIESRARLGRNDQSESIHASDLRQLEKAIHSQLTYDISHGIEYTPEEVAEVLEAENEDKGWWQRLVEYFKTKLQSRLRKEFDENWVPAMRKTFDNHVVPTLRKQIE